MLKIILKRYMSFYSLKRDRDKAKKIFYGRCVLYSARSFPSMDLNGLLFISFWRRYIEDKCYCYGGSHTLVLPPFPIAYLDHCLPEV